MNEGTIFPMLFYHFRVLLQDFCINFTTILTSPSVLIGEKEQMFSVQYYSRKYTLSVRNAVQYGISTVVHIPIYFTRLFHIALNVLQ